MIPSTKERMRRVGASTVPYSETGRSETDHASIEDQWEAGHAETEGMRNANNTAPMETATNHMTGMHEGLEKVHRRHFVIVTILSIPILRYSETLQAWLPVRA